MVYLWWDALGSRTCCYGDRKLLRVEWIYRCILWIELRGFLELYCENKTVFLFFWLVSNVYSPTLLSFTPVVSLASLFDEPTFPQLSPPRLFDWVLEARYCNECAIGCTVQEHSGDARHQREGKRYTE